MNGIIVQSGVIPCRVRRGRLEVALVTATGGPHWTIPKGHIEPDMSAQESAAKESYEEAGLIGRVHSRCLCVYSYEKRGATRNVRVYMMAVEQELRQWPERDRRSRRWMSAMQAAMCVRSETLRNCILRLHHAHSSKQAALPIAA